MKPDKLYLILAYKRDGDWLTPGILQPDPKDGWYLTGKHLFVWSTPKRW